MTNFAWLRDAGAVQRHHRGASWRCAIRREFSISATWVSSKSADRMRSRLLERAFTNSAARLSEGQAQYTIVCAHDGGTIDDLIVYRLGPERFMLCVNASNIDADREWMLGLNVRAREIRDVSDETALVAVQGPKAIAILSDARGRFRSTRFRASASRRRTSPACDASRRAPVTPAKTASSCSSAPTPARGNCSRRCSTSAPPPTLKPCGLGARDTLAARSGPAALWSRTRSRYLAARGGPRRPM